MGEVVQFIPKPNAKLHSLQGAAEARAAEKLSRRAAVGGHALRFARGLAGFLPFPGQGSSLIGLYSLFALLCVIIDRIFINPFRRK